jgi:hypothetical protein
VDDPIVILSVMWMGILLVVGALLLGAMRAPSCSGSLRDSELSSQGEDRSVA